MSENAIYVENGKVVGDSVFYLLAYQMLEKESQRLCAMTDELDRDPARKKENMAAYKCAKYRYATVSLIQNTIFQHNRCRKQQNMENFHYLLLPFDMIFKTQPAYLALYETAPADEKPDYSLYYAMLAFADQEIAGYEAKLQNATDWERVELEERIGGLAFAKVCLDEAWQRRKEVIE